MLIQKDALDERQLRNSEGEVVKMGESLYSMIKRQLPIKCKDPSMFSVPCKIGDHRF